MSVGSALRVVAAVLFACAQPALAGTNTWTTKGPPGGDFHDVEASVSAPSRVYAAYARSVFRSNDSGATWQLASDLPGIVADVAIDPTSADRLYVAVLGKGLYASSD